MDKYKLSIENREELTKIAMHDGWDKAFARLMEIAVQPEEIEEPLKFTPEIITKKFFENININFNEYLESIQDYCDYNTLYNKACDNGEEFKANSYLERSETLEKELLSKSDNPYFKEMTNVLISFDFNRLIDKVQSKDSKIYFYKDAIYALVSAIDYFDKNQTTGTWYCIGNWFAIILSDDKDPKFIMKLIYSLEESTNDW